MVNHKTVTSKVYKTKTFVPEEEQYRHENFCKPIIDRQTWEKAQFLLKQRSQINPSSSDGRKIHRYSGLIKCAECGAHFIAKIRTWGSRKYVEYTSTTTMTKNIAHRTEFTSLSLMSWCSEKFKISRKRLLLRARSAMKKSLR